MNGNNNNNIYDSAVKLSSGKTTRSNKTKIYYNLDSNDKNTFIGHLVDTATEMDDTNIIMDEIIIMANAYRQAHVSSKEEQNYQKNVFF